MECLQTSHCSISQSQPADAKSDSNLCPPPLEVKTAEIARTSYIRALMIQKQSLGPGGGRGSASRCTPRSSGNSKAAWLDATR